MSTDVEIVRGANYVTFLNSFRCDRSNQDEVVRISDDVVDQVALSSPGLSRRYARRFCACVPRAAEIEKGPGGYVDLIRQALGGHRQRQVGI